MDVFRRGGIPLGVLAACLAAQPLIGQVRERGAFTGTVRDERGQPLARATVIFRSLDLNLRRESRTDKHGRFYHGGFRPGRYHIAVLREGQIVWALPVTLPAFQEVLRLDIDLQKLRQAAEPQHLDPELEFQQKAERQRQERAERLQRHYNRGVRHLREDHPPQAIEEFEAALELEPDRAVTYAMLGAAYAAAERRTQAIDSYRRALALQPGEAAHHNNLATLLARAGRLEEALSHFHNALRLDPERAGTYQFNIGAVLLNAGQPAEAIPPLRQATRKDPTLGVAHYFLGLALYRTSPRRPTKPAGVRLKPRKGTIEAFRRYLQLEPDGEYAEHARDYLKELGAAPLERVSPAAPSTGLLK